MRRHISISLLAFLLLCQALAGQTRERVLLSTDRDVYVAGDRVWLSAWCVDAGTGRLSSFSKTAYVELHSGDAMVGTAKIALEHGRGAGRLMLPTTLPTGNYRLLAYTLIGASEGGFNPLPGSRTISVFNTLSVERSVEGVLVSDSVPAAAPRSHSGSVVVSVSGEAAGHRTVTLTNNGPSAALLSLSVRHGDGIPAPAGESAADFVDGVSHLPAFGGFAPGVVPEYEGEIVRTRVTGVESAKVKALEGKNAFMSSPGDGSGVYSAVLDSEGNATFFTSNIYGSQDMFLEIEGVDRDNICHLEIQQPFLDLPSGDLPPLQLSRDWAGALELRSLGMQLEVNFDSDTLYTPLSYSQHLIFDAKKHKSYILDDYRRFPLMEELFIEYIHEIRLRGSKGEREFQVLSSDPLGNASFTNGTALVLLDGIPVLQHEKMATYDPLLVKRIDIFPDAYFLGIRGFRGVVNFVTYKGNLDGMQFEDNVRVVSFQGCEIPQAFTLEGVGDAYPDYRQTLYWHPLLEVAPGESVTVDCKLPAYKGSFEVLAEGLTATGTPVTAQGSF